MTTFEPGMTPKPSGGYGSRMFDLFTTWCEDDALSILGTSPANFAETISALRSLGMGPGVGSHRGQPADAWSTAYASFLHRKGRGTPPPAFGHFLHGCTSGGGFDMSANEKASMWSSAFAGRALATVFGEKLPDAHASVEWVASCQTRSGGLAWGPQWAPADQPDVRATCFGLSWIQEAGHLGDLVGCLDAKAAVSWLRAQQDRSGGFRLNGHARACLWATADASEALTILGADAVDSSGMVAFTISNLCADGGFRRSPDHRASDVWSTRNGLRALRVAGSLNPAVGADARAFLRKCEVPDGGVGYRPNGDTGEAYTTSALILADLVDDVEAAVDFLHDLDDGGGISYMPGRGAEARATCFVAAAARHAGKPLAASRLVAWACRVRNPDGAWGIFEGRASTSTATCAVLASLALSGHAAEACTPSTEGWIKARWAAAIENPDPDLVELSMLLRISHFASAAVDVEPLPAVLAENAVGGGWRRTRKAVPDLVTTYQALLAHQALDGVKSHLGKAADWVVGLERPQGGPAWTPLARDGGGAIAVAFGHLIREGSTQPHTPLPDLTL